MHPDPAARLAAAIVAHAATVGVTATIVAVDRDDWASATFVGERQRIALAAADSPARSAWLAMLPDAEIAIRRHLLADLAIVATTGIDVTLDALLLEEG